jgi:hypothetical protein
MRTTWILGLKKNWELEQAIKKKTAQHGPKPTFMLRKCIGMGVQYIGPAT